MILVDFRNWVFDQNIRLLPNAQKELLSRDFDGLIRNGTFNVLDIGGIKPISISSLFFKWKNEIGVSAIKNISDFYETIDIVLEHENSEIIDYSEAAAEEIYFYGQNSLVTHLNSEIALCGVNEFSDESLFEEYCEDFELNPVSFDLTEDLLTSDVAVFVDNTLLICLEVITDKKTKKQLSSLLKDNDIKTISITKKQANQGVLDMMYIDGELLISKKAFGLLNIKQKEELPKYKLIEIPFLEKAGIKLRDIIL